MKKYSKKIALILALSLVLAIAIPALAADGDTVITGEYAEPVLSIVLPSGDSSAILNPLALPVKVEDSDKTVVFGTVKDSQIVMTSPLAGYNYGDTDLDIGVSVIGAPKGSFRLVEAKPGSTDTSKSGQIWFEVKSDVNLGYDVSKDTTDINYFNHLEIKKIVEAVGTEASAWPTVQYTTTNKYQVLVGTRAAEKSNMATIKAVPDGGTVAAENCFVARLNGNIVPKPKEAWKSSDGVKVTITWNIEPTPK